MEDNTEVEYRPARTKERVARVKKHLGENKKVYLTGAGCLCVGYILRGVLPIQMIQARNFAVVTYKSPQTNIILAALGDPGNVVQNRNTLETWPSQGALARSLKTSPSLVSAYFCGRIPDLKGDQYDIIGKAGHPIA